MSITLFKTLIAISDQGSFAAAADHVCVTQAAVGQQMRRLEDQFGVALFDRSEKTPRLNQLGRALVPKARAIVRSYETVLDDLTGDAQFIGELNLGAVPSAIHGLIPKSIKGLRASCPDLHIRVVPNLTGALQQDVERGALDAAVLSQPARTGAHLTWTPIASEPLVLITAASVTLDDARKVLETMPYIRHTNRSPVGWLADEWLHNNKINVRDAMEMGSLENVVSMVAHNLGVSVVPDICVPDDAFAQLRKIPLPGTSLARHLGLLVRADCSKVRLVERLVDQLKITVAAHGGATRA